MLSRCQNENCAVHILELDSSFEHISPQFDNAECLCKIPDYDTRQIAFKVLLRYHYGFAGGETE